MPESQTDMLMKRAEQAIEQATAAGAQGVQAWASRSREVEFTDRDGSLESVKDATSRSLRLALFVDGRYSSHSTTSLKPERLDAFITEAVALTRALEPDPHRQLTDPALFEGRSDADLQRVDPTLDALDQRERQLWLDVLDEKSRAHDKVISATSYVGNTHGESASASSNGFRGTSTGTSLWVGAEVTVRGEGDKRPEGGYWLGVRHQADLEELDAIAAEALRRAVARLGSTKGPSQKATMVVDPTAGGRLIGRLMGPANARSIYQGRSFWADKLGQKVFPELLSITDDPLIPRGLGSRQFDSEGIAAKRLPIIDHGTVANVYVDTYYGRKAELAPTTGSRSNVVVHAGSDKGLTELVKDADRGIYITSWLGGNADPTTGDYSFGVRGHLIEGGVIGAPVGEMNITGNLVDLFASLAVVGNDPWPFRSTLVPTLVFEDVDFSGV